MFDPNTRILVIDDMFAMRKLVTMFCKRLGFSDFIEAADGALAWKALNDANPVIGLIISDWNMPNSTGMDLLKRVRGDARFKALPFLLVTAEAEEHQVLEAVKAGVSNYIIKPFAEEMLKEKLEAIHKKLSES